MGELQNTSTGYFKIIGNWDWLPYILKKQFGLLTLSDVTFEFGKENDEIGIIFQKITNGKYRI